MENSLTFLSTYKIPFQKKGKTSPSAKNRLLNIEFCESIPRKGLSFNQKERQLLLHTTSHNEKIFIQYPGKETQPKYSKPWDFRPKLIKSDGKYLHDLSFSDIWNSLYDTFHNLSNKNELLRLLATEFYRIAFMIDYKLINKNYNYEIRDIDVTEKKYSSFYTYTSTKALLVYQPNKAIIDILTKFSPKILDVSWEAFLVYNDLLAFNEDCKYYYHGEYNIGNKEGITYIAYGTGRINTLLTHISIIGFILGEVKFSDILMQASRSRGVTPASNNDLKTIIGKYF